MQIQSIRQASPSGQSWYSHGSLNCKQLFQDKAGCFQLCFYRAQELPVQKFSCSTKSSDFFLFKSIYFFFLGALFPIETIFVLVNANLFLLKAIIHRQPLAGVDPDRDQDSREIGSERATTSFVHTTLLFMSKQIRFLIKAQFSCMSTVLHVLKCTKYTAMIDIRTLAITVEYLFLNTHPQTNGFSSVASCACRSTCHTAVSASGVVFVHSMSLTCFWNDGLQKTPETSPITKH